MNDLKSLHWIRTNYRFRDGNNTDVKKYEAISIRRTKVREKK